MERKHLDWRKIDSSGKIFPISTGKKYSTVFRLSAILNKNIGKRNLEKAVNIALDKYKSFKVRMKLGFFWYYFEYNNKKPIIRKERTYPCKYIDPRTNNNYLFKVTYFKNKINLDIFHSLADGNSASLFFKEIIYTYLELTYPKDFQDKIRETIKNEEYTIEDSYVTNYDKKAKSNNSSQKAYIIKGKKIKLGAISAIHQIIDFKQLQQVCKKLDVTVTQYLSAVLIYSIYTENYLNNKDTKPIKLCIPVDLRRFYQSKTLSNFFTYITLEAYMENLKTFEDILKFVKEDFKKRLTVEELNKTMSGNAKILLNPITRAIPLFLKKIIVRISYTQIRKYTTMTYSNIGRVGIIGKYQKYLDYFAMLIAPEPVEKIKCSSCTLGDNLVFTFTSILNDNKIEKAFYQFLVKQGIDVKVESNGVLDDISKKN